MGIRFSTSLPQTYPRCEFWFPPEVWDLISEWCTWRSRLNLAATAREFRRFGRSHEIIPEMLYLVESLEKPYWFRVLEIDQEVTSSEHPIFRYLYRWNRSEPVCELSDLVYTHMYLSRLSFPRDNDLHLDTALGERWTRIWRQHLTRRLGLKVRYVDLGIDNILITESYPQTPEELFCQIERRPVAVWYIDTVRFCPEYIPHAFWYIPEQEYFGAGYMNGKPKIQEIRVTP